MKHKDFVAACATALFGALHIVQSTGFTIPTSETLRRPACNRNAIPSSRVSCKRQFQWLVLDGREIRQLQLTALFAAGDSNDSLHDDHDESDEDSQEAYGRRSLSWTKRYRRLLPYKKARKSVMDLGLRSKQDWDDFVADGKVGFGPYLPNRPDDMYADDWISWDEFLGVMRPYDDARNIVQKVLQLKNMKEYSAFIKDNPGRAEGLRIPALPHIVYREKGWRDDEDFFGCYE